MPNEKNTNRELLIDTIIDFAGDEYESNTDWIKLAKKSERELIEDLINIAQYFRDRD